MINRPLALASCQINKRRSPFSFSFRVTPRASWGLGLQTNYNLQSPLCTSPSHFAFCILAFGRGMCLWHIAYWYVWILDADAASVSAVCTYHDPSVLCWHIRFYHHSAQCAQCGRVLLCFCTTRWTNPHREDTRRYSVNSLSSCWPQDPAPGEHIDTG